MHGLVATYYACDAKSLCALLVPVPQLLSCRAAAILCSRSEWCRKFVQRAALPISLADGNWLNNLPRQSSCVKFGGSPCRRGEFSRLLSTRRVS